MDSIRRILILGSGPDVLEAASWPRENFDAILAINNAWRVRPDWTHLIYPEDFPEDRRPHTHDPDTQAIITAKDFVPIQNRYGGFVYAGGTMAFTAGYWALGALKPDVMAFFGCDMVYNRAQTHFYGNGTADPLRDDVTLQSLEAKSARLMVLAAQQNCLTVNLTRQPESRLVFPRHSLDELAGWKADDVNRQLSGLESTIDVRVSAKALGREAGLGYMAESGRYWEMAERFNANELRKLDALWLTAAGA